MFMPWPDDWIKMKDLEPFGINILSLDVTDETSIIQGVRHILDIEKRIDVLINNAGFGAYGTIEDVPLTDAKYQLDVNVFGAMRLIQMVLPVMRENKFGKIVNVSSIGGKFAMPYGGWYHASKFALEALSDALRNEVKQFGIDVIVIEPGGVKSEWAGIAYDNLVKNSPNSAYKTTIEKLADFMEKAVAKNAEPIVIAKLILKSLETEKPKFRYVGGYMAKQAVIMRKLLPDKMFDRIIMGQMK
jgi:Short-chain dehydrogenases of various substrate specificities